MPYIKSEDYTRAIITPETPGELNFAITMLMIGYLSQKGLSYTNAQETISQANEAAAEFRRRVLVPYEDLKIAENGDVYPAELLTTDFPAHKTGG